MSNSQITKYFAIVFASFRFAYLTEKGASHRHQFSGSSTLSILMGFLMILPLGHVK